MSRKHSNENILRAVVMYLHLTLNMELTESGALREVSNRFDIPVGTLNTYISQTTAIVDLINEIRPSMTAFSEIWEEVNSMFTVEA